MRREHDGRRIRHGAFKIGDDVAAAAAEYLAGVIFMNLGGAELPQPRGEQVAHLALVKG